MSEYCRSTVWILAAVETKEEDSLFLERHPEPRTTNIGVWLVAGRRHTCSAVIMMMDDDELKSAHVQLGC